MSCGTMLKSSKNSVQSLWGIEWKQSTKGGCLCAYIPGREKLRKKCILGGPEWVLTILMQRTELYC